MKGALPKSYYLTEDVVALSRSLIGKFLYSQLEGAPVTGGIIVETEAYQGPWDKASHAHGGRRTKRNEAMYLSGGIAYVYLCYGMHALFNVVTNEAEVPHAVLVRAIEPTEGIDTILKRRKLEKLSRKVAGGPGALTKALGIDCSHDKTPLTGNKIWITDGKPVAKESIIASPRVGIDYAEEHASLPWRFRLKDSPWTSPAK